MKRFDIESESLKFKNLVSGPAPIGRILNYVYTAGTFGMYHKNGYRYTDLKGYVGYAWTTEFAIGLGIFTIGVEIGDKSQLLLTDKGKKLYDLMNNSNFRPFSESVNSNTIPTAKQEMSMCSSELESAVRNVFVASYPFKILKLYLQENGYVYLDRKLFIDDYFEAIKNLYDEDPTPYNRNARTTTGQNRVPSVLQLCQLFDFLEDENGVLKFSKKNIEATDNDEPEYSKEDIERAIKDTELIITDSDEIAKKYGIEGTILVESLVRNSTLQQIFKHNLMHTQHSRCVMCGLSNKELLVGSHIKPAVISTSAEKVDYNNGLLLCCNHDKLFDHHLISFNFMDGKIELSKTLTETDIDVLGIDKNYKLPSELMTNERIGYLMEHNMEFRRKEENR